MTAVGFAFLFVLFAVVAPLALYWFVREEDPDPSQTTSWGEARTNATEDRFGDGARGGRDDRRDGGGRGARGDERGEQNGRDDGTHWG